MTDVVSRRGSDVARQRAVLLEHRPPPLPYDHAAPEPPIDSRTIEHSGHSAEERWDSEGGLPAVIK